MQLFAVNPFLWIYVIYTHSNTGMILPMIKLDYPNFFHSKVVIAMVLE